MCQHGGHKSCSHKLGAKIKLLGRNRQAMALLCSCTCHESWPAGRRREVPNQVWLDHCACPGSRQRRDIEVQVHEDSEARQAVDAEVWRDIQLGRGRSAKAIKQEIHAAYETHDYEP